MQENVGQLDRWFRVALGSALVLGAGRALARGGAIGPGLLFAGGAIVLETAVTRVCPLNRLFGIDSRTWDTLPRRLESAGAVTRGAPNELSGVRFGAAG